MPKVIELHDCLNTVTRWVGALPRTKRSIVIGVAGGSASGKTSQVARRLADSYGLQALLVSMDNYYRGNTWLAARKAEGQTITWDEPEALDLDLLRQQVETLKNGGEVRQPIYDFRSGERTGDQWVKSHPIIIVEGLFALHSAVRPVLDFRIFVDIGLHGRIIRRLLRDVVRTSMPPDEIVGYFANVVEPMHQRHVEQTKGSADLIVRNEYQPYIESYRTGLQTEQYKFRGVVTDETLRGLPAEWLARSRQTDTYYHPVGHDLRLTDEVLRIRSENGEHILAYKGPRQADDQHKRSVIEFSISKEIADRFSAIYGRSVTIVRKKRTLYLTPVGVLAKDLVEKDDCDLGAFFEVRLQSSTVSPDQMAKFWAKLGVNPHQAITTPYHQM